MLKRYLLAPGPTPVPPEALLAMAMPIIHHRSPDFLPVLDAGTFDVITSIAGIEMVLKGMGYRLKLGSGVAVAQELLME